MITSRLEFRVISSKVFETYPITTYYTFMDFTLANVSDLLGLLIGGSLFLKFEIFKTIRSQVTLS